MSSSISLPVRVRTLGGGGLVSFIFLRFWREKVVEEEEEGDALDLHDGRGWLVVVVVCRGRSWVGGGGGGVVL